MLLDVPGVYRLGVVETHRAPHLKQDEPGDVPQEGQALDIHKMEL